MKQLVQDFKSGEIKIIDVGTPKIIGGGILVKNLFSVISTGTERHTTRMGQSSLLGKAKARPDLVKKVIGNVKKEGLRATYKKVRERLKEYRSLGYSSVGITVEVGNKLETIVKQGDLVACGGGGYAVHAEYISVPKNLCVKVPDGVKPEHAAFTTLGAIALQGIHQAEVGLGNSVAVIGLGLIGQLTVQLLKAAGCKVLGIDLDKWKVELAEKMGMDVGIVSGEADPVMLSKKISNGFGVDAVIIATSTKSNEPIVLAANMLRDRGRIVVVGVSQLTLEREQFYRKELDLRFSRSYGPGRYDPIYEEKGIDYPIGYVRWTERRNMETFLDLVKEEKVKLDELITHIFPIDEALKGYDLLLGKRKERYLGILIKYPETSEEKTKKQIIISSGSKITPKTAGTIGVGLIGAGNFARSYILPFISKRKDVRLVGISTSTGSSARNIADRYGFEFSTTDNKTIFDNEDIDLVIISTRHNSHAGLVIEALEKEKAVYVEKPLAIKEEELEQIVEIYNKINAPFLHVGFNRRFSQLSNRLKDFISVKDAPFIINYRINAGTIPQTHWIKDPEVGGGRIIGEVCHFIDYMNFITESIPEEVYAKCIDIRDVDNSSEDNISVTIKFKDGSVGNIIYTSIGDDAYPKEYIEIFGGKKVAIIEDFKSLTLSFKGKKKKYKLLSQDKGHANQINILVDALKKGTGAPIDFESIYYTTLTTFRILDSLRTSKPIQVK